MAIIKAAENRKELREAIEYIIGSNKTRPDLVGGWNLVDPKNAYEEMIGTKSQWNKTDGRAYKHYVQSFHPEDEITPEEAHAIAAEFAARSPLFREFEVVFATHTDRGHIHTHFVCNSVSIQNGRKYRASKEDLELLKELSDEIVREHGLPLADERTGTGRLTANSRDLYQILAKAQSGGKSSWMYDTARVVQAAAEIAADQETFIHEMENQGYQVCWGDRFVLYITPDGYKVRASRIEEIFRLPPVRVLFADREMEREQLRLAVAEAMQIVPDHPEPKLDYSAFRLDLTHPYGLIPAAGRDALRCEIAWDICRQLRGATSLEGFDLGMRISGYRTIYDEQTKEYTFHHPLEYAAGSREIAEEFQLPSISEALNQLALHRHASPDWDGMIQAEKLIRSDGTNWIEMLPAADTLPGLKIAEGADALFRTASDAAIQDTCAQMDLYICPDSTVWDHEIQAAALMLGQAICNPESLESCLEKNGCILKTDGKIPYILTPRGRKIIIAGKSIQTDFENPVGIGRVAVISGEYMCPVTNSKRPVASMGPTELVLASVAGSLSMNELLARLIGRGLHVVRRLDAAGKEDYELISDDTDVMLSTVFNKIGVDVHFPDTVPIYEQALETENPDAEIVMRRNNLAQLLRIVKNASSSTDRETFEQILSEYGCSVKWARNGMLTFVMPGGRHIRSAQLERRYNLPSIAAAYGMEPEEIII